MTPERSIDAQASAWFGRREVGLTPSEEKDFQAWLAADPRHAERYQQFDWTWNLMDRAAEIESLRALPRRRVSLRRIVALSLAAAAAVTIGFLFLRSPAPTASTFHYAAATDPAGFKKLELPDGSTVRLNASTAVTIDLSTTERRVLLARGEAFFNVAKDPTRPFIVTAAGHSVRAVGTAFNVSVNSDHLDVLVTEGKVRVEDSAAHSVLTGLPSGAEPPVLSAGQRVTVNLLSEPTAVPAAIAPVSSPAVTQALAWQNRMLEFDNEPLASVVEQFNRCNQHQLVILDPDLARRPFGGTFRADNYQALVDLLESRFNVTATRERDRTILRTRP